MQLAMIKLSTASLATSRNSNAFQISKITGGKKSLILVFVNKVTESEWKFYHCTKHWKYPQNSGFNHVHCSSAIFTSTNVRWNKWNVSTAASEKVSCWDFRCPWNKNGARACLVVDLFFCTTILLHQRSVEQQKLNYAKL